MAIIIFNGQQKALNAIVHIRPVNMDDTQASTLFQVYPDSARNNTENRELVRRLAQVKVRCFGIDQAHYCLFLKLNVDKKTIAYVLKATQSSLSIIKIQVTF